MNKTLFRAVFTALSFVGLLGMATPAKAQTDYYWNAPTGGTGPWDLATLNWSTTVGGPVNYTWLNDGTERANFGDTAGTVTLSTGITAFGVNFSTSGYIITGDTLTLAGAGGVVNTSTFDATINSNLAGTVGLTKNGTGTLTLGGSASGYTGVTNVNAGVLAITTNTALGDTTAGNGTTVSNGASLHLGGAFSIAEQLTLNGTGIANNGALRKTVSGTSTLTGGIILGSTSRIVVDAGTLATSGAFTGNQALILAGVGNYSISTASVMNGITALTKEGSGTLTINQTNTTWTGTININGGVLSISLSTILGINGLVTLDGGTLRNTTTGTTGSLISDTRAIAIGTNGGTIDVSASATAVAILAGTTTINQGANAMTKIGPGVLALARTINGTGPININQGEIRLRTAGDRLPDASVVTISNGAILNMANFNETVGSIAGAGSVIGTSGRLTAGGNNATTTFSGVMSQVGGFTKNGNGTLTLTGNNDYGGTTIINGGTLLVNGTHSGTGTVTVNATGALGGTGSLNGAVNVTGAGAVLAPGNSIGTLTVNNTVTIGSAAFYITELNASGSQADLIRSNSLVLNNPTLVVNFTGTLAGTEEFLVAQNVTPNTTAVTGTFAGLPHGSVVGNFGGQDLYVYYDSRLTGTNITPELGAIIFTPVPEPTTIFAIGALAFSAMGGIRRLRRRETVSPVLAA